MTIKKTILALAILFSGLPLFAQESPAELKKIIAVQQATIIKLNKNLEAAATAAANAKKAADDAMTKATTAATAASTAQTAASTAQTTANTADSRAQSAANSAGRIYSTSTGGGRSCRATCDTFGGSCVASFAGVRPLETWSCEANPPGNLICLCINL